MNATATPNWRPVEGSSNISAISYIAGDPATDLGELFIKFASGAEYKYEDFPEQLAEDFFGADSLGKFFHGNIRQSYPGVRFISNEQQDALEEKLNEDLPEKYVESVAAKATDDGIAEETGDERPWTKEELVAENEGMPPGPDEDSDENYS